MPVSFPFQPYRGMPVESAAPTVCEVFLRDEGSVGYDAARKICLERLALPAEESIIVPTAREGLEAFLADPEERNCYYPGKLDLAKRRLAEIMDQHRKLEEAAALEARRQRKRGQPQPRGRAPSGGGNAGAINSGSGGSSGGQSLDL